MRFIDMLFYAARHFAAADALRHFVVAFHIFAAFAMIFFAALSHA